MGVGGLGGACFLKSILSQIFLFLFLSLVGTSYHNYVRSFSILQSGEGSTSFNNDNSANFSGEKKHSEEFWGVYFLTLREKTLNQISYS